MRNYRAQVNYSFSITCNIVPLLKSQKTCFVVVANPRQQSVDKVLSTVRLIGSAIRAILQNSEVSLIYINNVCCQRKKNVMRALALSRL